MTEDLEKMLEEVTNLEHSLELYVPDINSHLNQVCTDLIKSDGVDYYEFLKQYRAYLKDRLSQYKAVK